MWRDLGKGGGVRVNMLKKYRKRERHTVAKNFILSSGWHLYFGGADRNWSDISIKEKKKSVYGKFKWTKHIFFLNIGPLKSIMPEVKQKQIHR